MSKKFLVGLIILVSVVAVFFFISFDHFNEEIEKYAPIKDGVEDRIVFFDIGNGDRLYLSLLIDAICECDPKVLAVDVFFSDLKNPDIDELLKKSLNRKNLVLATRHNGKEAFDVHPEFLRQAGAYGFAQSEQRGRHTSAAFYLNKAKDEHFASAIVRKYDSLALQKFLQTQKKQPLEIIFTRLEQQFKVYDFKDFNFDCSLIEGKIAYMGYFGREEDLHVTKARYHENSMWFKDLSGEPDMHGSIVVANQVLMILDQIDND